MKLHLIPLLLCVGLAACVPADTVPEVEDTKNIVVNGEKLRASEFLKRFCEKSPPDHPTCSRVAKQARIDNIGGGAMPKWR